MKSISKMLFATLILANLSLATQAQDKKQAPKKAKTEKMKPKEHVCTQACHDSGKHVYAHGEKGHVCTSACKK
jgi:hypothetical protein